MLPENVVCAMLKVVLRFSLITSIPQGWATRFAGFGLVLFYADMIGDFADFCTILYEGNEPHFPIAVEAEQ
jgi:hypothetical protein